RSAALKAERPGARAPWAAGGPVGAPRIPWVGCCCLRATPRPGPSGWFPFASRSSHTVGNRAQRALRCPKSEVSEPNGDASARTARASRDRDGGSGALRTRVDPAPARDRLHGLEPAHLARVRALVALAR